MTSKPLRAPMRPFLLTCSLAGALMSTACVHTLQPPTPGLLTATVPAALRRPCPRTERPQAPTVGELAGFSAQQEGDLDICEGQRDLAVHIIDLQNRASADVSRAAQSRPWWRAW